MGNSVQELLDMLHQMITEAWGLPLGAEKCVIERDKVLDLLDEIRAQFPAELAEAQRLIAARNEFISNAKKEADSIRKVAEDRARQLVDEQEVVKNARAKSDALLSEAETKSSELKKVANTYADDALRRTEEAITAALEEVRQSRSRFRSVSAAMGAAPVHNDIPEIDIDLDMDDEIIPEE